MNILIGFITAIHVIVALIVVVLVLMQKSKEQGVGAAFGGGMTDSVFGAGTTTALVRMTMWCAGILLCTSLILATLHARRSTSGTGGGSLMENVRPPAPPAPVTPPATPSQPAPDVQPEKELPAPAPASTPIPPAEQKSDAPAK